MKVGGTWRYLFRAIDEFGQVTDVFLSRRRDTTSARRFFAGAIGATEIAPVEVITDRYGVYPRVLDEVLPAAIQRMDLHANNSLETDPRAPEGPTPPDARAEARSHRQGHRRRPCLHAEPSRGFYDLGTDVPAGRRLADAFAELALVI